MINIFIKLIIVLKFNLVNVVFKILMFFLYISMECIVFIICNIFYMCLVFFKFIMFYLLYLNILNILMNVKFICGLVFVFVFIFWISMRVAGVSGEYRILFIMRGFR